MVHHAVPDGLGVNTKGIYQRVCEGIGGSGALRGEQVTVDVHNLVNPGSGVLNLLGGGGEAGVAAAFEQTVVAQSERCGAYGADPLAFRIHLADSSLQTLVVAHGQGATHAAGQHYHVVGVERTVKDNVGAHADVVSPHDLLVQQANDVAVDFRPAHDVDDGEALALLKTGCEDDGYLAHGVLPSVDACLAR